MSPDVSGSMPEYMSLKRAAALFPGRPHISTVWRWVAKGIHGVKLQTKVVGGRRFTTRYFVEQFIEATTAAANGEPPPVRPSAMRRQEKESAKATLRAALIDVSRPSSKATNTYHP